MKKKSTLIIAMVIAITAASLQKANAQNTSPFWSLVGNNNVTADSKLGTLSNFPLRFFANGTNWMRLETDGRVNINTQGLALSLTQARLAINSSIGQDPFRVMINGSTRFLINEKGGASIGSTTEGPAQGLYVNGGVGIGTASPAVKLHILSTNKEIARFDGVDHDYITIYENGLYRGYFGSSSGNAEDVDMGTAPLSTGKLHLTIKTVPKLTIDANGNVGIGTTVPANKFHVIGTTLLNGHVSIGSEQPDVNWDLKIGTTTNDGFLMGTVETLQDFGGNTFGSNSSIIPTSDNVRSLGSSTNRWHDVWAADGTINTSDFRDKKNIRDLDYGLSKLMQLHPVKFNWKEGINSSDKVGLIAQELQKVLPEVVRDFDIKIDEATGKQEKVPAARLGVIYTDLIPVLIKSIQELELQIDELKRQVNNNTSITSSAASDAKVSKAATNARLEQNAPNPFNNSTGIRYQVPTSVSNAQIVITNASGNTIKTFNLINKGTGSVTIKAGELAAGSYYYTLVVDGKKIDSKQMVLVK